MQKIKILQIGNHNSTLLNNLVGTLTMIQPYYDFDLSDKIIEPDNSYQLETGTYKDEYLSDLIKSEMYQNKNSDLTIGVTEYPLDGGLFSSSNGEVIVISLANWNSFSKIPKHKGLEYLIASGILECTLDFDTHYESKGCPNDYCDNLEDLDLGISKGKYCNTCEQIILSGLELQKVTISETASINRILDHVADRTICFVLMPFASQFTTIYSSLKEVIVNAKMHCYRADEIFKPTAIVNTIKEMIIRSNIIIADLTGRNPNVFYELGYAHALGKNTILITQNSDDVPFDITHRQYILYISPEDLRIKIEYGIQKFL
jgi:hypothetical protein